MKKYLNLLIILCLFSFNNIFGQRSTMEEVEVNVVTGPAYADEVYYSMKNGSIKTSARNNWDIAFTAERFAVGVMINDGFDYRLYEFPNADLGDWNDVTDTTGISTWDQLHNSEETWIDNGAFNANSSGGFDYGWGEYNISTHNVEGNNIYILQLPDGSLKKIAIVEKLSVLNEWSFIYSDMDGNNFQEVQFDADTFPTTNFIHYSLQNNQFVDQEAGAYDWGLLFTKYFDSSIPYYVTGVLSNKFVEVQEVSFAGLHQIDYFDYDTSQFSDIINTIGSDWKYFDLNAFKYNVADSTVFFIMDFNEDIYKLYFVDFSGSSTGTYTFIQEKLTTSGIDDENSYAGIFPNPANDILNVIYNIDGKCNYQVFDVAGRIVDSGYLNENNHLNKAIIDVSDLNDGFYNIRITNGNKLAIAKFIKN